VYGLGRLFVRLHPVLVYIQMQDAARAYKAGGSGVVLARWSQIWDVAGGSLVVQQGCYAAGRQVHIFAYKLKLGPMLRYPSALTVESLAARLAEDAVIQEFASHPSGACVVNVGLQKDRDSHEDALNELLWTVQELGYAFVEAEITKIADRALEMAIGGGIGGLGAGSATKNGEIAVIGAFAGWVAGLLVGANMEKVEVIYRVQRTGAGWHFIRVEPQPAVSRPALQAG
jgi:hypothetical protein